MKPEQSVNVPGEPRTWTTELRKVRFQALKKKLIEAKPEGVLCGWGEPSPEPKAE